MISKTANLFSLASFKSLTYFPLTVLFHVTVKFLHCCFFILSVFYILEAYEDRKVIMSTMCEQLFLGAKCRDPMVFLVKVMLKVLIFKK